MNKLYIYREREREKERERGRGQGSIREMDKQLRWSDKWPMC